MALARIRMAKKIAYKSKGERTMLDWAGKHSEGPPIGRMIGGTNPITIPSKNSKSSLKNLGKK